jgi:hypothetical protein
MAHETALQRLRDRERQEEVEEPSVPLHCHSLTLSLDYRPTVFFAMERDIYMYTTGGTRRRRRRMVKYIYIYIDIETHLLLFVFIFLLLLIPRTVLLLLLLLFLFLLLLLGLAAGTTAQSLAQTPSTHTPLRRFL